MRITFVWNTNLSVYSSTFSSVPFIFLIFFKIPFFFIHCSSAWWYHDSGLARHHGYAWEEIASHRQLAQRLIVRPRALPLRLHLCPFACFLSLRVVPLKHYPQMVLLTSTCLFCFFTCTPHLTNVLKQYFASVSFLASFLRIKI